MERAPASEENRKKRRNFATSSRQEAHVHDEHHQGKRLEAHEQADEAVQRDGAGQKEPARAAAAR